MLINWIQYILVLEIRVQTSSTMTIYNLFYFDLFIYFLN